MVVRGGQIKCVLAAASTAAARSVRGGQVRSEIISKTPKVHTPRVLAAWTGPWGLAHGHGSRGCVRGLFRYRVVEVQRRP